MATKYLGSTALSKLCELVKSAISTLEAAIPTKTSDLTNDSGFITSSALEGYATATEVAKKANTEYVTNGLATKLDKSTITVESASKSNVTVATGTATNICSVTLAAGTWIVKGQLYFSANTSGYRIVSIGTSKQWSTDNTVLVGAAPTQGARLSTTEIFTLTASTTYYLVAYQNSGSSLTGGGNLQAVRLK